MVKLTKTEIENLKKVYEGKEVHVITRDKDGFHDVDTWGKVTRVDESGNLHGTWGSWVAIPNVDYIGLND